MILTPEQMTCEHDWETIGQCSSTGPTWKQIHDHDRCRKCGRHVHRTTTFMDGRFAKGAKLQAIRDEEWRHCRVLQGELKEEGEDATGTNTDQADT